jgi:predicted membrane metal-binding protein
MRRSAPARRYLDGLDSAQIATMHSIVKVLGGGGGPADQRRAAPYLERARAWSASLPPASGLDPETYRGLALIVSSATDVSEPDG